MRRNSSQLSPLVPRFCFAKISQAIVEHPPPFSVFIWENSYTTHKHTSVEPKKMIYLPSQRRREKNREMKLLQTYSRQWVLIATEKDLNQTSDDQDQDYLYNVSILIPIYWCLYAILDDVIFSTFLFTFFFSTLLSHLPHSTRLWVCGWYATSSTFDFRRSSSWTISARVCFILSMSLAESSSCYSNKMRWNSNRPPMSHRTVFGFYPHTHTCVERWQRCANGIPNAKRNKLERHDVNACGTRELNKYLPYGTERLVKYTSTGGGGRTSHTDSTTRPDEIGKLLDFMPCIEHRCDVPLESWIEHFFRCRWRCVVVLVVTDVVVDALWLHHTSHNFFRVIFNIIERQENWSNFSVVFCELFATGCLCCLLTPKTMAERRTRRIDRHIRGNSLN